VLLAGRTRGGGRTAAGRIRRCAAELTNTEAAVEPTGTIFVPGDEVVLYLFNGSAEAVREACNRAATRFGRVVSTVELEQRIGD
jgi:hypothetical protein